jgi:hypothetical protein
VGGTADLRNELLIKPKGILGVEARLATAVLLSLYNFLANVLRFHIQKNVAFTTLFFSSCSRICISCQSHMGKANCG